MFVVSLHKKLTRKLILLFLIAVILLITISVRKCQSHATDHTNICSASTTIQPRAFLKTFGWQTEEKPLDEKAFVLPLFFDETYQNYNQLQKIENGLDLTPYLGKTIQCFTYRILNYPDTQQEVHATLYLYRGKIIAGDIHSPASDGFMHGFRLPGKKAETADSHQ